MDFSAGAHVAYGDAAEEPRVGHGGLNVFAAVREIPRTGGQHDRLAGAVQDGIEDRAELTHEPGCARHRAINEVEGAEHQVNNARGEQHLPSDQVGGNQVPAEAEERDHVRRHAGAAHATPDRAGDIRGDALRQQVEGH